MINDKILLNISREHICVPYFSKLKIDSIIHMEVYMTNPKYKRVVLKLSGEALAGDQGFGIYPSVIKSVAEQVKEACRS